jgi:integrase
MSGKLQHLLERNGRYFARMGVPENLRAVVGKRELLAPLGPDLRLAKAKLHAQVAAFQEILDEARTQLAPVQLADRRPMTTEQMARRHFGKETNIDLSDRRHHRASHAAFGELFRPTLVSALRQAVHGTVEDEELDALIGWAVDAFDAKGTPVPPRGTKAWRDLALALAAAQLEAHDLATKRDAGDWEAVPKNTMLMGAEPPGSKRVGIDDLFSGYMAELAAVGKGKEAKTRWRPVFDRLKQHLGHDDAARMSRADFVAWKDALVAGGLAPKTIRDVYLAAVKAVVKWAVVNGKLKEDPTRDVQLKTARRVMSREKGFTAGEANAILAAARTYTRAPKESEKVAKAKRWLPFLCAYSGARVGELAQLRKEDVREDGGIYFLRITDDAGSTKMGWFRDVPLHPHLIELGFVAFAKDAKSGPLFHSGSATGADTTAERVSKWVRGFVIDPRVQPSHGWRHRFKTIGDEIPINGRVLDAIQGHAARTAGDNYGDVTLKAKAQAIKRFPRYSIK